MVLGQSHVGGERWASLEDGANDEQTDLRVCVVGGQRFLHLLHAVCTALEPVRRLLQRITGQPHQVGAGGGQIFKFDPARWHYILLCLIHEVARTGRRDLPDGARLRRSGGGTPTCERDYHRQARVIEGEVPEVSQRLQLCLARHVLHCGCIAVVVAKSKHLKVLSAALLVGPPAPSRQTRRVQPETSKMAQRGNFPDLTG